MKHKAARIFIKNFFIFLTGGGLYFLLEVLYRGGSHWTMFILGGICFLSLGYIGKMFPRDTLLPLRMLIGAATITLLELITGLIVNIGLGWNIWDYSHMPLNFYGQICLPTSIAWYFLSAGGFVLDDYLRFWIFGEKKPKYRLFRRRKI